MYPPPPKKKMTKYIPGNDIDEARSMLYEIAFNKVSFILYCIEYTILKQDNDLGVMIYIKRDFINV